MLTVRLTSARALLSDGKSPNRQGNLSAHHETADAPAGLTYRTSVNHFVNHSAARRRAAATQFIPEFYTITIDSAFMSSPGSMHKHSRNRSEAISITRPCTRAHE